MTKSLVLFSFVFLWMNPSNAQVPFFQHYFLLKKNEPVQVNRIFQDRAGFIWYGTNRGLFRFNGREYLRYTDADSLPDNNVTAIAEDSLGRIWTGHRNGKLAFLERGVIRMFDPPEGSAAQPVSDIIFDRDGRLWFSTLNDGLYFFDDGRLYRLDEIEGMPDLFIYDLLEDHEGNIWAGTDGGIAICSVQQGKPSIRVLNYSNGLPDNIVKKLALHDDNRILIATEDAGVTTFDPTSGAFASPMQAWSYGSIADFSLEGNKLWIASTGGGLMLFDMKSQMLRRYNTQVGYDLPPVISLYQDREGNLWAGSKSGVARTAGDRLEFLESTAAGKSLDVLAVAVDRHGDIWFSTHDGLFLRTLNPSGEVTVKQPLSHSPHKGYTIISLYIDTDGYVWAGLYGEGVLRINPGNGKVRFLNKELRNGNVLHITGRKNEVWLATLGGSEKITFSGDDLRIVNYSRHNGLSSDFIYQVFLDSRGRVWFATDGRGVDMMDDQGIHHYEKGLPATVVYGFAEDSLRQIWVNVQANGIFQFSGEEFIPLQANAKLRSNDVNCFTADEAGHLVVVHDLGIDVLTDNNKVIRYYGEESGIRNKRATLNAVAKDDRGNLFIGALGGIIRCGFAGSARQNFPIVFIDNVKVFDQPVEVDETTSLAYDENSISINFMGFWFQNAENLQYQYTMENFDDNWIATRNNSVTYSKLPPGDYTFRIKASDTEDFSRAREASLKFHIAPPFWNTIPFYMASLALLIMAGYSFVKYREKALEEENVMLEKRVEERTLEIQRKTEEIQAQNEEIMAQAEEIKGINENLEMLVNQRTAELEKKNKALEEYAFINAHKLRSPLASILGLINLISKTNLDDEAKVINRHLQQSADELDEVIRSITKAIERGEK